MMQRVLKLAALIGLAIAGLAPAASANVIYTFVTQSATLNGSPANGGIVGEIVLTDAGNASGSVSVTTDLDDEDVPVYHSNGIVSVNLAIHGPDFSGFPLSFPDAVDPVSIVEFIDLSATVNGSFLDINIGEDGPIFSLSNIIHRYSGESVPLPHLVTITYDTDDEESPCYFLSSTCSVTGFFVDLNQIPEPTSLSVMSMAVVGFAVLGVARTRRRNTREV